MIRKLVFPAVLGCFGHCCLTSRLGGTWQWHRVTPDQSKPCIRNPKYLLIHCAQESDNKTFTNQLPNAWVNVCYRHLDFWHTNSTRPCYLVVPSLDGVKRVSKGQGQFLHWLLLSLFLFLFYCVDGNPSPALWEAAGGSSLYWELWPWTKMKFSRTRPPPPIALGSSVKLSECLWHRKHCQHTL